MNNLGATLTCEFHTKRNAFEDLQIFECEWAIVNRL